MSIHNNFPATSWIKLDGISVTKGENVYIVKDFKTNLKYIFWSSDIPDQLTASNVMLSRTSSRFLIAINNKGECILVPNEEIVVSFDGNSVDAITEHIWGLYEKDEEYGNRFVSVEQDIDGITNTVGQHTEEIGKVNERVTKVDQKADSISLSVKEVEKEYNNDKEARDLRENLNGSIINLNSSLGIFKSEISDYFKDNKMSNEEIIKTREQLEILKILKIELDKYIDKVVVIAEREGYTQEVTLLTSAKASLDNTHNNLISIVENSIIDSIITPTEITNVIDAFGRYSTKVSDIKSSCDNIIVLGMGGVITDALSRIDMTSDEIKLSVSSIETDLKENVKNVDEKYSEILLSSDGIVSRVGSVESKASSNSNRLNSAESSITQLSSSISSKVSRGDVKSIIEQSPDEIKYGFNDISDYVTISTSGLTVNRGSIACDSIKASSTNPIIKLFEGNGLACAIDATSHMNEGVGTAVRLKRDDNNYIYVGGGNIAFYITGSNNNKSSLCTITGGTSNFVMNTKGGKFEINSGLWYNGTKMATITDSNNAYNLASTANTNASSALSKANSAYSLASGALYSSDLAGYINTSIYPRSAGSYHCGKYNNHWDYVVANNVCWWTSGGHAFLTEEKEDNGKVAYNFLKHYKKSKLIKYNVTDFLEDTGNVKELSEEDQLDVINKIDEIYDICEESSELYTKGSVLTETIAEGVEYLIQKIETLENKISYMNELQNKNNELENRLAKLEELLINI